MVKKAQVVRVISLKNQSVIADKCYVAECFMDRLMGLIGKARLNAGEGMLFPRCNSIHMWFMRFPIDVVFLKREKHGNDSDVYRVVSAHSAVRPWRVLPLTQWRASETLELPEGIIRRAAIVAGDRLCIS